LLDGRERLDQPAESCWVKGESQHWRVETAGANWDKRRSQWRRRLRTRRSPKPKLFKRPRI